MVMQKQLSVNWSKLAMAGRVLTGRFCGRSAGSLACLRRWKVAQATGRALATSSVWKAPDKVTHTGQVR